jgi:hypothetical protein
MNYLLRSKQDGKYLVARIPQENNTEASYLLVFKEDYEALSYINTHGKSFGDRLSVEPTSSHQIQGLLQRWGYAGIGLVEDPLIPEIKFIN